MASAVLIAASRLNAREGTGGLDTSASGARQNRVRNHPGTAPRKIAYWDSRPDLLNDVSGRGCAKSQFRAAATRSGHHRLAQRSRARYQLITWRASQGLPEITGTEAKPRSAKIVLPSGEPRIR